MRRICSDEAPADGSRLELTDQAPFTIEYVDADRLLALLSDPHLLAAIRFESDSALGEGDPRVFSVGLPQLGEQETIEVWRSRSPARIGEHGPIRFAANEEIVFAHMLIREEQYGDLQDATRHGYEQLLGFLSELGYPHPLRIWNYVPDINLETAGLERYKRFCVGRAKALEAVTDSQAEPSAACALGTCSPGLLIYSLAAKRAGLPVQNPRQVNAFKYPSRYGPRSPSFSRALLKAWDGETHLYLSGTSSIVGHETLHEGEPAFQLDETLRNLESLAGHAEARVDGELVRLDFSLLKVYLRNAHHYAATRHRLEERFGPQVSTLYLHADICRSDLAVEIDGHCRSTGDVGAQLSVRG